MDAHIPKRIFTKSEKRRLVAQLKNVRTKISLSSLYQERYLKGRIPSKRTLYRLLEAPNEVDIQDSTAQKIEVLLSVVTSTEIEFAASSTLLADVYPNLRKMFRVDQKQNRAFLDRYSGNYKCIRLTTRSREILVTHLRIYSTGGSIPRFAHTEVVPDEANRLGNRTARVLAHEGFVFPNDRKILFVSFDEDLRQISCQASSNTKQPCFSGILLTRDAADNYPFATRIFIEKTDEPLPESSEEVASTFGLFSTRSRLYRRYLPYIRNDVVSTGALYPNLTL